MPEIKKQPTIIRKTAPEPAKVTKPVDEEDADGEESASAVKAETEKLPEASLRKKKDPKDEYVRIVMSRTCAAPHVGHVKVAEIIGSPTMVSGKTYRLPLRTAEAIEDQGGGYVIRASDTPEN